MSDIINDNGVVGFTRVVTLSGAGSTVLDDFKYDIGNNAEFERTDNNSKTTGFKAAKGVLKGSATAQLATASVDPSTFWGQTFTVSEGSFVIIGTGRAETKNGETKANITFRQTVGSVVVS
jgi:hypothetical protein